MKNPEGVPFLVTEPKRLYRDVEKGMIGGVLAGLAEYLGADVTVVRVVYVLLWVFTAIFPGLIAYIVMWIIVPPKPTQAAAAPPATPSPPTPPPQW